MRLLAKIGIGVLILTIFLLAIPALKTPTTPIPKDNVPNESNTPPPSSHDLTGTVGEEVVLGNFTIEVYPPTYTKTFYEEKTRLYYEGVYRTYTARRGHHFALIKVEATNVGIIEDEPTFYDPQLTTTKGLIYKHQSTFNSSDKYISPPPTPVVKTLYFYPSILPRETRCGHFHFEIPTKATPDHLTFTYWESTNPAVDKTVTINL